MAALDQWAQRLMHAVNAVHSGQDPSTGATIANVYDLVTPGTPVQRSFFSGTGAADIAVNSALVQNPGLIAASRTSNGSGDGSNAQAIAALQQDALAGGTASGGPTLNGQLQTLATTIGNSASSAQAAASDQTLMVQHLQQLDQQTGGVSLNEEAANLQVYQLAYQAASKALTVLDAMLDQLINKTGVG
jgi:flagellar hook-associated protein 1 FlgK